MEFILYSFLAFAAAFRGWGVWPFALLALPFAPLLAHASSGGEILSYSVVGSTLSWVALVGLIFMIVTGRIR